MFLAQENRYGPSAPPAAATGTLATALSWHLDILPPEQRLLWDKKISHGLPGWVLYGGTALALRLGHRQSVDFDFFSHQRFEPLVFNEAMGFGGDILQASPDTLSVLHDGVKLSFFGGLSLGAVAPPTMLGACQVASLEDIAAGKLAALVNRVELKDYLDIAALLAHGSNLSRLLGCAEAVYRGKFPSAACLKSLTWFDPPELALLPEKDRRLLESAALGVQNIGKVPLFSERIGGPDDGPK